MTTATKAYVRRRVPTLAAHLGVRLSLSEAPSWAAIELQDYQRPPAGDWRTWVFKAARNTGKTLTASVLTINHLREAGRSARVGVMAPTDDDAIKVCAEGETGLITLFRSEFPRYNRSTGEAWHYLGGYVQFMGSTKPAKWNGPQWSLRWIDEAPLCNQQSIREGDFALRLGEHPREIWTMTPRGASRWLKERLSKDNVTVTRATIYQNRHASAAAVKELEDLYKGTSLGRAFLLGEDVDIPEGAIWPMLGERQEHYLRPMPELAVRDLKTGEWSLGLRFVRSGAGVDWGMSKTHHAIALSGSVTKEGVIWIRRAYRGVEAGSRPLIEALASHKGEIGATWAAYDRSQSGLEDWIEDNRKSDTGEAIGAGLIAIKGNRNVEWRAGLVLSALEKDRLFFDLNGEGVLAAYDYLTQYHRDDDGEIVEEADDDADALCYLVAEFEHPTIGAIPAMLTPENDWRTRQERIPEGRFSERPARGEDEAGGMDFRANSSTDSNGR